MIRPIVILAIVVLAGAALLNGQEETPDPQEQPTDSLARRGQRIFNGAAGCHGCHGRDGRGTEAGPDLTDREWLHGSGTIAEIRERVELGVSRSESKTGGAMPIGGWEPLRPEVVEAVAAYVHWLGRGSQRRH
jgi:mono/diheme cytochrome c family protein